MFIGDRCTASLFYKVEQDRHGIILGFAHMRNDLS